MNKKFDSDERVNISWFGTTGDSIKDDTEYIQELIDKGLPIPNGNYLISKIINV